MRASYIRNHFLKTIDSMRRDPAPFVSHPGVDFTRTRKCPFHSLLLLILTMEAGSLNRELRRFFTKIHSPVITRSAFIQQRSKLNDKAFPFLFSSLNKIVPLRKTFRGYHLLACDGSDVNIPPKENDDSTRVPSNTAGVCYHQFHLNALYDLLEERYIDLMIQPRAEYDERKAFLTFIHRNAVPGKCIFIADRGYCSFNVLSHLLRSGQFFLLRVRADDTKSSLLWRLNLPKAAEYDLDRTFFITRSRRKIYREAKEKYVYLRPDRPFDHIQPEDRTSLEEMSVRLLKVPLSNGDSEFLVTNLARKDFSAIDLKELYSLRWGIETSFRFLKYTVALNAFHSIRRDFIIQEIYARIILYNFTKMVLHCIDPPQKAAKYKYKVSVTDAVVTCRDFMIHKIKNAEIRELLCRYRTDIRPGRTFPRKVRSKRYIALNNRT